MYLLRPRGIRLAFNNSLLSVLVLLFILEWNSGSGTNFQHKTDTESAGLEDSVFDSIDSSATFIEQEINYYAPQSATVFLIWKTENYPIEESVLWNDETKFKNDYLCSPMFVSGDTFSIKLKVPPNSTLEYYFWITKNKQGHYQDFWDVRSGGKILVNASTPVLKTANYSKAEEPKSKSVIDYGLIILLILGFIYALLTLDSKKMVSKNKGSHPN
jgi:lipoteichoic acid synthase